MADGSDDNEENFEICSICHGALNAAQTGKLNCCSHQYCFECITQWSRNGYSTCPLDRLSFQHIELYRNGILDASQTYYPPMRPQDNIEFLSIDEYINTIGRISPTENRGSNNSRNNLVRRYRCISRSRSAEESSGARIRNRRNRLSEPIPQRVNQDSLINYLFRHRSENAIRLLPEGLERQFVTIVPLEYIFSNIRTLLAEVDRFRTDGNNNMPQPSARDPTINNDSSESENETDPPKNDDDSKKD